MNATHEQKQRPFGSRLRHTNLAYLKEAADRGARPLIRRNIAFVLLEHFSLVAFTGALDTLVTANLISPFPLYRFRTLSLDTSPVRSDLGIDIPVDGKLAELDPAELDMLIVCGGYRSILTAERSALDKLRATARHPVILGGLWNGSYLLAHAGLLDGYACTVHPESRAGLEEAYPKVHLLPHHYVIDRDRISCAGANSAIGMMLAVIRHQHGCEAVRGIEEILACDRAREEQPGLPMQALTNDPALPGTVKVVLELMESNVEEPLSIHELAHHAQLSPRQLDRLFMRHLKASPARYYLELRITRARRLLLQTSEPVTTIALACGFAGAAHFSRCYRDFFGVSPTQARQEQSQG